MCSERASYQKRFAFAAAYYLSYLFRTINALISESLIRDFGLDAVATRERYAGNEPHWRVQMVKIILPMVVAAVIAFAGGVWTHATQSRKVG
jgi:hypothetical protein